MVEGQNDPRTVMDRFTRGINEHDLEAIVACFADDYRDVEPAHPKRRVRGGIEEVRKNWRMLLDGVPDLRSEVALIAVEGDVAFIEQGWSGTRADATDMHLRGVNVFGVRDGKIAWGRVYMEAVEEDGIDLEERVRQMASGEGHRTAN